VPEGTDARSTFWLNNGRDEGKEGHGAGGLRGSPGARALRPCAEEPQGGVGKGWKGRSGHGILMMSEEALIGARVRVGGSGWRSEWHGLTGTITAKWGNPEHLAFDVRLDDGRTQLFWHHELEGVAEGAY
jgi:hypothetical protein